MDIKKLTDRDDQMWELVAAYAENCSWGDTGKYLADLMRGGGFSDWERVFAAVDDDSIIGFCALTKTSTVFGETYAPYLGFLFVGETYRGNGISKKLCSYAIRYAKTAGFDKVYLYSDLPDFYENLRFEKIGEREAPWGVTVTVYSKDT
jgi:predicted N-acetyltransferase YhbS